MRSGFLARHRVGIASVCVLLLAAGALVAYALSERGYAVRRAELNDGGIWVTRNATGQFGRLNKPVGQLDGAMYSLGGEQATYSIDVLQDGAAVVAHDLGKGELYPVDVAGLKASEDTAVALPADAAVAMDDGVLAVLDRAKGTIRAVTFDPESPLSDIGGLSSSKPLATIGASGAISVAADGSIVAVSAARGLTTIRRTSTGFATPVNSNLGTLDGTLSITSVGDEPVVLATPDAGSTAAVIRTDGSSTPVPTGAVLQQAGPSAGDALVATPTELLSVPLGSGKAPTGSGKARTLLSGGTGQAPAAPVRLAGCDYAAWPGTTGVQGRVCDGSAPVSAPLNHASSHLAFRVNRGQLLLNDVDDGSTWNVDAGTPTQVANWQQITKPRQQQTTKTKDNHADTNQQRALPPKPADDELGARPGHTTPLYVLDNDSDPSGEILAVDSVIASGPAAKWLTIAPDGQAIDIALPPGTSEDTTFKYVVRAPKGGTASASVVVHARTASQNADPVPRKGAKARTWSVPANGTVTIPVLPDWRDYTDGDPVVLSGAKASGGQVSTTPDGALIYVAPDKPGHQTISYTVGDGHGGKNAGSISIDVQGDNSKAVAPVAEPDFARGEVGKPITVYPLGNDLPGSDPLNPTASLRLAGSIASPAGTDVRTDANTGTVAVTAAKPGRYVLSYQAAYGSAPFGKSAIRVDVDPAGKPQPPVTSPDTAVLHAQSSVDVDVLSNDSDPQGNLLAVVSATPSDPSQLSAAVIDGQFVHLVANTPHLSPATQTVDYVVSDGVTGEVHGQITVTQLPASDEDTPITLDDTATVRTGQSVAIPVLDNDSTPDGDPLSLQKTVASAPAPGQLTVSPKIGAAYVSGDLVRYVAPAGITKATSVTVEYVAQNESGSSSQRGYAQVTITPPVSKTNPDQPPVPPLVESRVVAGDTASIKIPTTGIDPDGDAVTLVGIGSAPVLGRVTGMTASAISYQAYPLVGNGGTDTFSYVVQDTAGATAQGTIRVAVVQPGDPQPPLAVNDAVTVAPNATVRVDVEANDLIAPGDTATIAPLAATNPDLGATAKLLGRTGPIQITAGADVKHPVVVVYELTDGVTSSRATVTVKNAPGVNLPPVAVDQYAKPVGAARSVRVNLLHQDFDPDGTDAPTVVSPASAVSGTLTVALTSHPQVIPYVIRDAQGATATAVVYVPASGAGLPYPKPGATIKVPTGGSTTVDIRDYVVSPAGKTLRTTTTDTLSASPAGDLTAGAGGDGYHVKLTAAKGYAGPAAVTFQVTDGATLTTRGATLSYLTVPVQVGDPTPVLHCPSTVTDVIEGGPSVDIPVATVCHVWLPTPGAAFDVTARWKQQPKGTSLTVAGTRVTVQADGSATPQALGTIVVGVAHTAAPAGTLTVRVVKAPAPTIDPPIVLDGVKAGDTKTIDIAGHVDSPFGAGAHISVVGSPRQLSGMPATISAHGSSVTVSPGKDSHGTIVFSFVATDVADTARTDRQVSGEITLHVLGHPDTPTGLAPGRQTLSDAVALSWTASADNGAPLHYVVRWTGAGSGQKDCGTTPSCNIAGLKNGRSYRFTVTAVNAVGSSTPSNSVSAVPDTYPAPPSVLTSSDPRDATLRLTWSHPTGDFSAVTSYVITGAPGGAVTVAGGGTLSTVLRGLDNNATATDLTIYSVNKQGRSRSGTDNSGTFTTSAGAPAAPQNMDVEYKDDSGSDARAVAVTWDAVNPPNGQGPVSYTVTRTPGGQVANCVQLSATTCFDQPAVGSSYTYSVTATNLAGRTTPAGHTSPPSTKQFTVASTPSTMPAPTIAPVTAGDADGTVTVSYTTAPSHGSTLTVHCSYSTDGSAPGAGSAACPGWSNPTYAPAGGSSDSKQLSGLPDGASVRVALWEDNGGSTGNQSADGTPAVSGAQTTNGPPTAPTNGSCSGGSTFSVSWSGASATGARQITSYRIALDGGGAQDIGLRTSYQFGGRPQDGAGHTVHVWSYDGHDQSATSISIGGCTDPAPPPSPSINAYDGGKGTSQPGTCSGACHTLNFTFSNFPAGKFSWECLNASGVYYNSADYGYTVDTTKSYTGTAQTVCESTNDSVAVRVDGVQSKFVHLGSG